MIGFALLFWIMAIAIGVAVSVIAVLAWRVIDLCIENMQSRDRGAAHSLGGYQPRSSGAPTNAPPRRP